MDGLNHVAYLVKGAFPHRLYKGMVYVVNAVKGGSATWDLKIPSLNTQQQKCWVLGGFLLLLVVWLCGFYYIETTCLETTYSRQIKAGFYDKTTMAEGSRID